MADEKWSRKWVTSGHQASPQNTSVRCYGFAVICWIKLSKRQNGAMRNLLTAALLARMRMLTWSSWTMWVAWLKLDNATRLYGKYVRVFNREPFLKRVEPAVSSAQQSRTDPRKNWVHELERQPGCSKSRSGDATDWLSDGETWRTYMRTCRTVYINIKQFS